MSSLCWWNRDRDQSHLFWVTPQWNSQYGYISLTILWLSGERKGLQLLTLKVKSGGRKAAQGAVQGPIPDTVAMNILMSDDIWWQVGSRSCPALIPRPHFSPCCATLSFLILSLSSHRRYDCCCCCHTQGQKMKCFGCSVISLPCHRLKKICGCAARDEWMPIRGLFLLMPWRNHRVWLMMIPEATSEWRC